MVQVSDSYMTSGKTIASTGRIFVNNVCYLGLSLEKAMATHSSVLAWRIPGTAEPGGLPSMGPHRVGHD